MRAEQSIPDDIKYGSKMYWLSVLLKEAIIPCLSDYLIGTLDAESIDIIWGKERRPLCLFLLNSELQKALSNKTTEYLRLYVALNVLLMYNSEYNHSIIGLTESIRDWNKLLTLIGALYKPSNTSIEYILKPLVSSLQDLYVKDLVPTQADIEIITTALLSDLDTQTIEQVIGHTYFKTFISLLYEPYNNGIHGWWMGYYFDTDLGDEFLAQTAFEYIQQHTYFTYKPYYEYDIITEEYDKLIQQKIRSEDIVLLLSAKSALSANTTSVHKTRFSNLDEELSMLRQGKVQDVLCKYIWTSLNEEDSVEGEEVGDLEDCVDPSPTTFTRLAVLPAIVSHVVDILKANKKLDTIDREYVDDILRSVIETVLTRLIDSYVVQHTGEGYTLLIYSLMHIPQHYITLDVKHMLEKHLTEIAQGSFDT